MAASQTFHTEFGIHQNDGLQGHSRVVPWFNHALLRSMQKIGSNY